MSEPSILLETGTNEVEIIEFTASGQTYGINVAKLREILIFDRSKITPVAVGAHESVMGLLELRNRTLPLVDLSHALDHADGSENTVILVCEFNGRSVGFSASGIRRIHRVSWEDLLPLNNYLMSHKPMLTGVVSFDGRIIKVLDLEHLVARLFGEEQLTSLYCNTEEAKEAKGPNGVPGEPGAEIDLGEDSEKEEAQKAIKRDKYIILAEDSVLIRESLVSTFHKAGHEKIKAFSDGRQAFDFLVQLTIDLRKEGKRLSDAVDVLITDIEMPQMDGLTLCNRLKSDGATSDLRIVIFSSLIDAQLALKCEHVKADAYMVKPKVAELMQIVSRFSDELFDDRGLSSQSEASEAS